MTKREEFEFLYAQYKELGISEQIDYDKFYLYSIITHSTAIEGSTVTELENQILFEHGISAGGRSISEQNMNLDLKAAYERCIELAESHSDITIPLLKELSSLVMKNTGKTYKTILGDFSSCDGDLRLLNVTAGFGGRSYLSYSKVTSSLAEFCRELNKNRREVVKRSVYDQYLLSFDAHYDLVTIHPWADGNGRMSRLLMNMLQFEYGLIPTKVFKEDKNRYITALVETRESDDKNVFREFMTELMCRSMRYDIRRYIESTGEEIPQWLQDVEGREKKESSREKILRLLKENGNMTTNTLAETLHISAKAVEKQLMNLKKSGRLVRVGPDKGGHWEVTLSSGTEVGRGR